MRIRFERIPWVVCLTATLTAFAAVAAAAPAAPKPPTNDDCLGCHEDATLTRDDKRSVHVDRSKFEGSVHGQNGIACVDCHTSLAAPKALDSHPGAPAPASCEACHDAAVKQYAEGVHAEARKKEGANPIAATCVDCHGTHDIRPSKDPESRTHHLKLPDTCARCHGDPKTIAAGHIAIGNVSALYDDSIHGRALKKKGLIVAPNCNDCHGNHAIHRAKDPRSGVYRKNVPTTCGKCHEGVLRLYEQGIHGLSVQAGNPRAPVCIDCHTAHHISDSTTDDWKLHVMRECGSCHKESVHTYRDTYHGQVTRMGFARVATCADCHGAHDIFPKRDDRSLVSDVRRTSTCRKCHANATDNFAKYDPHADTRNKVRNPLVWWISFLMKGLLVGVFSFFGIHTALWLPRSWAERRRHGRGHPPAGGDKE